MLIHFVSRFLFQPFFQSWLVMEEYIEPSISKVIIISYEGEREKDSGHMHGKGACKMDNGCSYIGEFQKGLFHGKGKFLWTDGTSYEGDFRSGIVSYV